MKRAKTGKNNWSPLILVILLGVGVWGGQVQGDEITWLGTASVAFTNPPNWQGGKVPLNTSASTGDVAVFGTSFTPFSPELTANRSIYGLKFLKTDGGWTLGGAGRQLTLGTNGIDDTANVGGVTTIRPRIIFSSGLNTVPFATGEGGQLLLEGGLTNNVNMVLMINSGTVIVSRIDADANNRTFTKRGEGTLILTNAAGPTQQGAFVFGSGRLVLGHPQAIGGGQFRAIATGLSPSVIEPLLSLTGANAITNSLQWGNTNIVIGPYSITFSGPMSGPASGNLAGISNILSKGCRLLFSGSVLMSEPSNPTKTCTFYISGPGETEFSGNLSNGADDRRGILRVEHPLEGLTILSGANTYTGDTTVAGGVLLLRSANALPGGIGTTGGISALTLSGGILGLGYNDFLRPVTNAAGIRYTVRFSTSGGFAAFDNDRTVNLGGAGQPVTWGADFVPNNAALILGAPSADRTVTFVNPIILSTSATPTNRTVIAYDGTAEVDGILQGTISHGSGACRLNKQGNGTLALTANNTYAGGTWVQEGELRVQGTAGSGTVQVFSGAALSGTGQVAAVTLQSGGRLKPYDIGGGIPSHLTVTGALSIASGTLDLSGISNAAPGSWPLATAGSIVGESFASIIPGPAGRTVQLIGNQIILRPMSAGALIQIR